MDTLKEQICILQKRLDELEKRQRSFSNEINQIQKQIDELEATQTKDRVIQPEIIPKTDQQPAVATATPGTAVHKEPQPQIKKVTKIPLPKKSNFDFEKFIGENLLNKIGILITIIGVVIGSKYSIENNLVSPLTRIIMGYISSILLLGFGIKLKNKYLNYSAVLVSGAIAIMYFITFAAYSLYELIPQTFSFALMVVFTIFTIITALNYNKQIIGHIGLVGAYSIPFLLSNGSGQVGILFSYMIIINIGILIISFNKYWKPLYYSSFGFTWVIFLGWYSNYYTSDQHFNIALIFLFLFFTIFYLTALSYKLLKKEQFNKSDVLLLLGNSFLFYGIGFSILEYYQNSHQSLGLFTVFNALIHFSFSIIIRKYKLADKNLFYLIVGLVLVFITIAIPVQLDGNWVTLLWTGEAALLFWLGRIKRIAIYEKLAYPIMFITFISIIEDWNMNYSVFQIPKILPLFNINFVSSIIVVGAFGFITKIFFDTQYPTLIINKPKYLFFLKFAVPLILLIVLYQAFQLEISFFFNLQFHDSKLVMPQDSSSYLLDEYNYDIKKFKTIWIINYSLLFMSIMTFVNSKIKNNKLNYFNLLLGSIVILYFLFLGLYTLGELRDSYIDRANSEYYEITSWNIIIRYISLLFLGAMLYSYKKFITLLNQFPIIMDTTIYTIICWIISSELINCLELFESDESYKLGLSILWGIYALLLIGIGIKQRKKHLRIGAITLFGITLIKLFFYDISHLNTLSKTIVFMSLGVLLLLISFLYNKYMITDETKK